PRAHAVHGDFPMRSPSQELAIWTVSESRDGRRRSQARFDVGNLHGKGRAVVFGAGGDPGPQNCYLSGLWLFRLLGRHRRLGLAFGTKYKAALDGFACLGLE